MTTTTTVTVEDLLAKAAWARKLARNLLHDGDSADDLVQETWIAALRAKPDREQPLRPWLGRVLRNRAANRGRDDARREARHHRTGGLVAAAASADPEELVGRFQMQRLLAELITQLREPSRQTLLLRYYEGLTSEQIGAIMGVAPGTVRRRLKDTIDELRAELDRRHQGDREAWLRALLPLAPPGPATPAPTTTAEVTPERQPTAQNGDEPARPTASVPSARPPVPVASLATSLSRLAAALSIPKLAIGVLVVARSRPPSASCGRSRPIRSSWNG
jgi:RNA polymerase sigma factor (sigma-70 family)